MPHETQCYCPNSSTAQWQRERFSFGSGVYKIKEKRVYIFIYLFSTIIVEPISLHAINALASLAGCVCSSVGQFIKSQLSNRAKAKENANEKREKKEGGKIVFALN